MKRRSKIKDMLSRVLKPGSDLSGEGPGTPERALAVRASAQLAMLVLVATFCGLLDTANAGRMIPAPLSEIKPALEDLSRPELMRYAQSVQDLVAQDPETFRKLIGEDVRLMLADPDLQRADGPTVAWQYRSQSCVLDVYFKTEEDRKADASAVVHYEMRPRGIITAYDVSATPRSPEACLQSIYAERRDVIEARFLQMIASRDQRIAG